MVDPLNTLRDIHLPLPVSSWPPSLFLVCVSAALCIGIFLAGWYSIRFYRRSVFQRGILRQLAHYEQAFHEGACTATIASDVSSLLKQVAYVYFSRETIAGLYGEAWFVFLKSTAKNESADVLLIYFTQIPYQKDRQADLNPLFVFAKAWLSWQFKTTPLCDPFSSGTAKERKVKKTSATNEPENEVVTLTQKKGGDRCLK